MQLLDKDRDMKVRLSRHQEKTKRDRLKAWQSWIGEEAKKGTKAAFAYIKKADTQGTEAGSTNG